jgi:hypothetical protein
VSLFIAYLRRPQIRNGKKDPRRDPYYFEGSFGSTGCHDTNLLHPQACRVSPQDRMCFLQPGSQGRKLVFISSPVRVQRGPQIVVRWDPSPPLKYEEGLPLDVELARCFNPKVRDDASIGSHLRSWSQPAVHPEQILNTYDKWISERTKRPNAFATRDKETIDPMDHARMPPEA